MKATIQGISPLSGTLVPPPDKAIVHRAVLAGLLAEGETRVHPWPRAEDCRRTLDLAAVLGARSERSAEGILLFGPGQDGIRAPSGDLFCGESGTTLRLAAGILAAQPFRSRLTAAPSLARRPMRRIALPLAQMGATVVGAGTGQDCTPPLSIEGCKPLRAIRFAPSVASAQVKSAVLLAGLGADGPSTVVEPAVTRDHTERMLRFFGARIRTEGRSVTVEPGALVSPGEVRIPGDISGAAFFIVACLITPGSRIELSDVGLNPTRTGFLTLLGRMGADIQTQAASGECEPCGRIRVRSGRLSAVDVRPEDVPGIIDELPVLMVAAACAQGTSTFRGLSELRVKETDRVASMLAGLRALGAGISEPEPDAVTIEGGSLRCGEAESANDHRTAMSLAVAALAAEGRSVIHGAECVGKSYPDFFEHLGRLVGPGAVKTG